MTDERSESSNWEFLLDRREFLQLSAASPFLVPGVLEESGAENADSSPSRAPSEGPASALPDPSDVPSPTERRDYFPLESEHVSIRGLAPAEDASTAKMVQTDSQRLSLRKLAAWRSDSNPADVFDQAFPNSVREIITPQGLAPSWIRKIVSRYPDPYNAEKYIPPGKDIDVEDIDDVVVDFSVESEGSSGWENWVGGYYNPDAREIDFGVPDHPDIDPDSVSTMMKVKLHIRHAAEQGIRFRAVGSGHSHSEAAAPEEWFTDMKNVSGKLEQKWLRAGVDRDHLVRVGAGTILRDLNRNILADEDLALDNMGSWDGQTLAGAINTSTHGTGLNLAPIADLVESVEIVCSPESQYQKGEPYVRQLRIEPEDGITDPEAFAKDASTHDMGLIQNDDLFHSVVVGYGCMGIAYAYTLRVRDFYWLEEETELMPWNTLKEKLSPSGSESKADAVERFVTKNGSRDVRHFQFLFNVAAMQSPHKPNNFPTPDKHRINDNPICLIRRHYLLEPGEDPIPAKPSNWEERVKAWSDASGDTTITDTRWPPERRARRVQATLRAAGNKIHPLKPNKPRAKQLHRRFFHTRAEDSPFVEDRSQTAWYIALRRLRDKNQSKPQPPSQRATTTEVGVPLEHLVDAVEDVKTIVDNVTLGDITDPEELWPGAKEDLADRDVFFFPPMGVRFTANSEHVLSAEYGRKTAMLEVPFNVYEKGVYAKWRGGDPGKWVPDLSEKELREEIAKPALEKIQDQLVTRYDGRPHMGKHNTVDVQSNEPALRPQNMYPEYEKWWDAYRYLNKFDVFDGPFTDRKAM